MQLDELLQELLDRVGEVVASRERLSALLDAVVGIGSGLELRGVLTRIVEAACALVGARYGALGVIGLRQLVQRFGATPEASKRIEVDADIHIGIAAATRNPQPSCSSATCGRCCRTRR